MRFTGLPKESVRTVLRVFTKGKTSILQRKDILVIAMDMVDVAGKVHGKSEGLEDFTTSIATFWYIFRRTDIVPYLLKCEKQ